MKKQLLFALTLLVGQICFAGQSKTKTCDNNVSQVFKNVFIELPGFREIQGGSKIVVIYDNSVPMEMQGAFEYAVKLWEEVLPMTLPIKIDVKVDNLSNDIHVVPVNYFIRIDQRRKTALHSEVRSFCKM